MISSALALIDVWHLAPRTTMPSALLVDDVHVEVGIGLRVRRQRAVALHVGLRHRDREVAVAAVLGRTPAARSSASPSSTRSRANSASVPISLISVTIVPPRPVTVSISCDRASRSSVERGSAVVGAVLLAGVGVLRDREVAVQRIVPDLVVERGVVDRDPQLGLGQDVGNAPTAVPEHAAVAERRPVLVSGRRGPSRHCRRAP